MLADIQAEVAKKHTMAFTVSQFSANICASADNGSDQGDATEEQSISVAHEQAYQGGKLHGPPVVFVDEMSFMVSSA